MNWDKKKNADGDLMIDSDNNQISVTFSDEGSLCYNSSNNVMTWNSIDITQINMMSEKLSFMYDPDNSLLMFSIDGQDPEHSDDKCIYVSIKDLIGVIERTGMTLSEMEKLIAENKAKEEENKNER